MGNCLVCGRELPPPGRGRPQQYCTRACRARAYRERVAEKQQQDSGQPEEAPALTVERIVAAAIALADRDGGSGLSMRRTAAELGVGAMSLYRYVPGKEELGGLMIDEVFGQRPLPEPGPPGWRAKLELSAQREWEIYVEHPWAPQLFALTTRPPVAPRMMAYTDWRMRAIDGLGLDFETMVRVAIMVSVHTQSAALSLAREKHAKDSREHWLGMRNAKHQAVFDAGRLTMIARFGEESFRASEPASIFEFGLQRLLDGVAQLILE
ncbi:TetR/AcrR family transcriptional regulator [Saccharopolyspora shandongensis]|uniref:TetR/AcrR family transcriptional regulator n=1 Tax=Saccharopolyspora shandongensis TaxID=418495 RepID=UPI00342CC82F